MIEWHLYIFAVILPIQICKLLVLILNHQDLRLIFQLKYKDSIGKQVIQYFKSSTYNYNIIRTSQLVLSSTTLQIIFFSARENGPPLTVKTCLCLPDLIFKLITIIGYINIHYIYNYKNNSYIPHCVLYWASSHRPYYMNCCLRCTMMKWIVLQMTSITRNRPPGLMM